MCVRWRLPTCSRMKRAPAPPGASVRLKSRRQSSAVPRPPTVCKQRTGSETTCTETFSSLLHVGIESQRLRLTAVPAYPSVSPSSLVPLPGWLESRGEAHWDVSVFEAESANINMDQDPLKPRRPAVICGEVCSGACAQAPSRCSFSQALVESPGAFPSQVRASTRSVIVLIIICRAHEAQRRLLAGF